MAQHLTEDWKKDGKAGTVPVAQADMYNDLFSDDSTDGLDKLFLKLQVLNYHFTSKIQTRATGHK